ncbi:MAG: hypothetical protein FWB98_01260, partial [Defluviitaleaceae bacterium]|nr:hypothetical protein [Defluviitaleaceae bacterium]
APPQDADEAPPAPRQAPPAPPQGSVENPSTGDDGPESSAAILAVPFFASVLALFGMLTKRRKDNGAADEA